MTMELLAAGADLQAAPRNGSFEIKRRRTVASHERETTEMRLHEALAREAALVRERDELIRKLSAWRQAAANHFAGLTSRECQIMDLVLAGHPSKIIAANLGISQRTVENHRAAIMKKTGSKCLPALARLALAATWGDAWDLGAIAEPASDGQLQACSGTMPADLLADATSAYLLDTA